MQDPDIVHDIINITNEIRPDVQVELQTRMYNYNKLYEKLNVIAFSISDFNLIDQVPYIESNNDHHVINRHTLILTDTFNEKTLDDILNKMDKRVQQLTLKILQTSNGFDQEMDEWIEKHRLNDITANKLQNQILDYDGDVSIFFDESCMDATNRYMVYRPDANLYANYDTTVPIKKRV